MINEHRKFKVPELSLVLLVGASGSGKSTFAKKFFKASEIVSSDTCRAMVSDDENNQAATKDAFELARYITRKRLKNGLLTVIDATNARKEDRLEWLKLAREYHFMVAAMVFDLPENICIERNENREEREIPVRAIKNQVSLVRKSRKWLRKDGFKSVYEFSSQQQIDDFEGVVREPLYNNKKQEKGAFDIIGDVHGCYVELEELLLKLNYTIKKGADLSDGNYGYTVTHAQERRVIFVGDLVDRGPKSPEVLRLVMGMVNTGVAFCVPGNHDAKLKKYLEGRNVQLTHGLEKSVEQFKNETEEFKKEVREFIYSLISHYVFDDGKLAVAHAGIKEEMIGRGSGEIRTFCLYGETTGEIDEFGLPVRYNWASEYEGKALIVYGHTPVPEAQFFNNTIDIDTGCVFGGKLTALRYPENELVAIEAKEVYAEPVRPIETDTENLSLQQQHDDALNIDDVIGKLHIETRLHNLITVREEQGAAAIEVMSRFAANPKWLIYLPPTMSPSETSDKEGLLEYPKEAFTYYKNAGLQKVVCEEKHMGSRAVVVICKDNEAALNSFGIETTIPGVCYTRTGRNFFNDEKLESEFINRVNQALTKSNFWGDFETDWVCLDCELMPWSAKAQSLLSSQYAAVGSASKNALNEATSLLEKTKERLEGAEYLFQKFSDKKEASEAFIQSYRKYCWEVDGLEGYELAPFHIMATEGKTWLDKDHEWHMEKIKTVCAADEDLLLATPYKIVELDNEDSILEATKWWEELTAKGGEGMVVKSYNFIEKNEKGLLQPAIKIRGQEYLRIIYGAEYSFEHNIKQLKNRNLRRKRALALSEFSLGVEALERFVEKQPLRKVHQCVFGVLALESEPIDPRL